MNIGWFALFVAAVLAIIALVCFCTPAQARPRQPEKDYNKIYAAMYPREL